MDLTPVDEPAIVELPPPMQPSRGVHEVFSMMERRDNPGTWVARIPNGRVVGSDSVVVGFDDTVYKDLANHWPNDVGYHQILLRAKLPRPTRISGSVAVVAAARSNNYFHWLVEIVPRLRLLGERLHEVDHIVVPSTQQFQRDCLMKAGVPMDRLIEPHRRMHLIADDLIVPSLVPTAQKESVAYLHGLFADWRSAAPASRRLYATRSNVWRRLVANESELVAALAPLGFETVVMDGLSVGEQARLFSEAAAVVGPNGSQLANVIFSQPGSVLIEMFDTNYFHVGDWDLIGAAGGHYHIFTSSSPPTSSQWRDIVAPIDDVLAALAVHGID